MGMEEKQTEQPKNEIVVYQPDETIRLDVRLENDTVWLTQSQMAQLFGCGTDNIGVHLKNIYAVGELDRGATTEDFSVVRKEGTRTVSRKVTCYNLDAIISVGYRVNSVLGVKFRKWATEILKDYLLRGYAINARMNQIEERIDRRLSGHDAEIAVLQKKVDFFVRTSLPPVQKIFFEGEVFDADAFVSKHILSATKSILLIDNWVDIGTLEKLSRKASGVTLEIVTSKKGNKIKTTDIASFTRQYGGLTIRKTKSFHDRFLIIDGAKLYHVGASLKDLGNKCFAIATLDAALIPDILAHL